MPFGKSGPGIFKSFLNLLFLKITRVRISKTTVIGSPNISDIEYFEKYISFQQID